MERTVRDKVLMTKIYIGAMSKNVVDAVINFSYETGISIGIIVSRRQIDFDGGYVNNWNTETFCKYVRSKSNILLCRDHGGPNQGKIKNNEMYDKESFIDDFKYFDIIHIDPFKSLSLMDSAEYIADIMIMSKWGKKVPYFEVGTEEAIYKYDAKTLDLLLNLIKTKLGDKNRFLFDNIIYAVIQSGTKILNGINIGKYDMQRMLEMISVCNKYNLYSKEHNGDYLSPLRVNSRFLDGLSAINIAPQAVNIESGYIKNRLSEDKLNRWLELCIADGQWSKWFSPDINVKSMRNNILLVCGHYVFSHPDFCNIFCLDDAYEYVRANIDHFIMERIYG